MTGSHFVNPNGLFDPRHVSTARDIAILATALLRDFPEHAHYFSQQFVAVGKRKLANRNSLIRQMPEADGMKTGFVCNSGFNLVATATHEGRKLGAVIFGANSGKHRADLAEMLLVDGFTRQTGPRAQDRQHRKHEDRSSRSRRHEQDGLQAASQSPWRAPKDLGGWGISFGNYESSETADMALRGRLLSPAGKVLPGTPGLIRMPGKGGYAAAMWNLDQQKSLAACAQYRTENAPCEVITPETFAQIAALTPEPAAETCCSLCARVRRREDQEEAHPQEEEEELIHYDQTGGPWDRLRAERSRHVWSGSEFRAERLRQWRPANREHVVPDLPARRGVCSHCCCSGGASAQFPRAAIPSFVGAVRRHPGRVGRLSRLGAVHPSRAGGHHLLLLSGVHHALAPLVEGRNPGFLQRYSLQFVAFAGLAVAIGPRL